jgi:hypothetical protein
MLKGLNQMYKVKMKNKKNNFPLIAIISAGGKVPLYNQRKSAESAGNQCSGY